MKMIAALFVLAAVLSVQAQPAPGAFHYRAPE